MNRSKLFLIFGVLALLVASAPGLLAQSDPKIGYLEWPVEAQSRNIPAGSVNDAGSHLTYILDTGVNARELLGDASLATATGTPIGTPEAPGDLAQWLDADGDGTLDPGAITQNFVGITNTHPTLAVTVHFRYYNDNCEDVLDFLVVLTCNDTLLFDPFNFEIPGTGGENTQARIFGPQLPGTFLTPISTEEFGSGRFILSAAASGASTDADDDAEILFPNELGKNLTGECNIVFNNDEPLGDQSLDLTLAGERPNPLAGTDDEPDTIDVPNVGRTAGLNRNNLHIFNAFQISFNYLVGVQTYAVPRGGVFQAGGINAWARPAIDRESDIATSLVSGQTDGDGPHATTGKILLGGEIGTASDGSTQIAPNTLFLRNEVHGGDIQGDAGLVEDGGHSEYGALASSPLFSVGPAGMVQHFISVTDDYNGSNNAANTVGSFVDRSANIGRAATTYVLQIYDNNEDLLEIIGDPPLNVSPPVGGGRTVNLKLVCICMRTFLTDTIGAGTSVDDVTIQEMADIYGAEVLNGQGDFDGLLVPVAPDLSGGWIRYVRDNTNIVQLSGNQMVEIGLFLSGFDADDLDAVVSAHGPGTSTWDTPGEADSDNILGPSFLTIANQFTKVSGFGALWWKYAVAADAEVSETGDPNP